MPDYATPGRVQPATEEEKAEIKRRLRKLNVISFLLGIPGIALQVAGNVVARVHPQHRDLNAAEAAAALGGLGIALIGTGLLIAGLAFSARVKGRSGWWGLLGLLSCIGLLVLYFVPKICSRCRSSVSFSKNQCPNCEAPV